MMHHQSTSFVVAVLGSVALLASRAAAWEEDTLDNPPSAFRTCSPLTVKADTPFLVKAVNYTRYHDTLGSGTFDPDTRWNSLQVQLARGAGVKPLGCSAAKNTSKCEVTTGPVCVLIDCIPLGQDPGHLTNDGATAITDFVIPGGVPGGAGPDGPWYDLGIVEFNRRETGFKATLANLSVSSWRKKEHYQVNQSSLRYDNGWRGFNVTGMAFDTTGTMDDSGFYPFELQGDAWPGWGLAHVPCAAYPCARRCAHEALGTKFEEDYTRADYAKAQACIDQCEGVDNVVNFCPDAYGGKQQVIDPKALGLDSQAALDAYLPDGCAKNERLAFPAAASSYAASMASKTALPSSTSSATSAPTGSSDASGNRVARGRTVLALAGFAALMVQAVPGL
ncbi:hypothetical protein PG999_003571 [Apiospora kogelbergensis]|uniref:Uncharacterized protein n=1 Tax=Apiospora kogelbergensis TaxID=1337665 RepID=A0AAW0R3V0_9PEZI